MSADCQGQLHERLPARPEHIARLRHEVNDFAAACGASDREREDIAISVSEALSNAVLHAYAGQDRPGVLAVNAWMHERSLIIVVCDEGDGMVRRTDSPGLGLGLSLIARLTERLDVETLDEAPGTRVRMSFAIGATAGNTQSSPPPSSTI